jgi:hypothetical protein
MFLKNNDLGVLESALIPHLFPHFFVVFARHLTGFFVTKPVASSLGVCAGYVYQLWVQVDYLCTSIWLGDHHPFR